MIFERASVSKFQLQITKLDDVPSAASISEWSLTSRFIFLKDAITPIGTKE
jgi:hypothetical protein